MNTMIPLPSRTSRITQSRSRRHACRPVLEPLDDRVLLSGSGALDSTFNGTGLQTAALLTATNATALQSDGKMVVVGTSVVTQKKTNYQVLAVTRFNANGSLDTSFGSGGVVKIQDGQSATAAAVAIQPDGKILVTGTSWSSRYSMSGQYVVVRLNARGSLDTTFASKGSFHYDPSKYLDLATSMTVLGDGSIIVAGQSSRDMGGWVRVGDDYDVIKLTSAGKLVTSFGAGGQFRYDFGGRGGHLNAITAAPNGDLILAGDVAGSTQGYRIGAIVAVTSSGKLDTAFNGTGFVEVASRLGSPPDDFLTLGDVAIQNGKILVAGNAYTSTWGGALVARYSLAGALDTTFGSGGSFTTSAAGGFSSLALEADGSIVAGGWHTYETIIQEDEYSEDHNEMTVAHLTIDGALDTSFGSLGTGFVHVRPIEHASTGVAGLVVGPDGKISACGSGYAIRLTAPLV